MQNLVSYLLETFPTPDFISIYFKKEQPVHIYPTPQSIEPNIINTSNNQKIITINTQNTNPFNNATFFIILQLMILLYMPVTSFLAPYYEDDPNNIIGMNNYNQGLCENASFLDSSQCMFKLNIDDYGHQLFPSLEN
eukprot:227158_1